MIDFVKFVPIGVNVSELCKKLEFESIVNQDTGELRYKFVKYTQMTFKVFYPSERVEVKGSLHQCFNELKNVSAPNQKSDMQRKKGFNGNSFNYTQLCHAIDFVCSILGVHPTNCILSNIEFGLNISHPYLTFNILNNLIRQYGKPFTEPQDDFFQTKHSHYFFKCYDKGKQFNLPYQCIRIELKYFKMEALNKLGLKTLADLKNKSILSRLSDVLQSRWQEVLLYDYTIRESELTPIQHGWLSDFKNKNYWNIELKNTELDRHKKRLSAITNNNSDNIQTRIANQIQQDWKNLEQSCVTVDRLSGNCKSATV